MELPINWKNALAGVSKISLSGGIVGKICIVLIVIAIAISTISFSFKNFWVTIIALVMLFILAINILNRLISLAGKNPIAALFEGSELLVHEQMRLGFKGRENIPFSLKDFDENTIKSLEPADLNKIDEPDSSEPQKLTDQKLGN